MARIYCSASSQQLQSGPMYGACVVARKLVRTWACSGVATGLESCVVGEGSMGKEDVQKLVQKLEPKYGVPE